MLYNGGSIFALDVFSVKVRSVLSFNEVVHVGLLGQNYKINYFE